MTAVLRIIKDDQYYMFLCTHGRTLYATKIKILQCDDLRMLRISTIPASCVALIFPIHLQKLLIIYGLF